MNLTYEQCKSLKDAGFPEPDPSKPYGDINGLKSTNRDGHSLLIINGYWFFSEGKEKYYIPTLSELIETCGDEFGGLQHWPAAPAKERWEAMSERIWVMEVGAENPQFECVVYGPTPEEAVCNLYLALKGT